MLCNCVIIVVVIDLFLLMKVDDVFFICFVVVKVKVKDFINSFLIGFNVVVVSIFEYLEIWMLLLIDWFIVLCVVDGIEL